MLKAVKLVAETEAILRYPVSVAYTHLYWVKSCQALPIVAGELDAIDVASCKFIDDKTVDSVTFEPYAPLLRSLTNPYVFLIVSESWCQQYGDDLSEHMMGTGPFKFVSRTVGDRVEPVSYTNLLWMSPKNMPLFPPCLSTERTVSSPAPCEASSTPYSRAHLEGSLHM